MRAARNMYLAVLGALAVLVSVGMLREPAASGAAFRSSIARTVSSLGAAAPRTSDHSAVWAASNRTQVEVGIASSSGPRRVARATALERSPIALQACPGNFAIQSWVRSPHTSDRRRGLQIAQVRKRLPRLGSEEPPWA